MEQQGSVWEVMPGSASRWASGEVGEEGSQERVGKGVG